MSQACLAVDDARRLLLERAADSVDLAQALAHHLGDIGAATRNVGDQPGRLELAQRFAHRPLAGAEFLGDAQFDQSLAGIVVAADYAAQQCFLEALAQRRVDESPCTRRAFAVLDLRKSFIRSVSRSVAYCDRTD